jgi:hypothetical protein
VVEAISNTGAAIPRGTTGTVDNLQLVQNVPSGSSPVTAVNAQQEIEFAAPPNNYYIHVNIKLRITAANVGTGLNFRVSLRELGGANWIGLPMEYIIPEVGLTDGDELTTVYGFITPTTGATSTVTFALSNQSAHDVQIIGTTIYGWRNL